MFLRTFPVVAIAACLLSTPAVASTTTVIGPGTLFTNPTSVGASSGAAYDTWYANNVRSGGATGITAAHPDNGAGSIQFKTTTDSNSKADFEYYLKPSEGFLLSSLTDLSYDVYRSSSSTASSKYAPAMRLYVSDGTHTGYLVYEGIYNGVPVAPVDAFATDDLIKDYFWSTGSLPGAFAVYNRTLADWEALLPNLTVYGFSTGVGSGWDGTFDGAVDNISYTTRGNAATTYNFEVAGTPAATPEPSSIGLMGSGLMATAGMWLRRRRANNG